MNTNRTSKYQRLLQTQVQKVKLLRRAMAVQQRRVQSLIRELAELQSQWQQLEAAPASGHDAVLMHRAQLSSMQRLQTLLQGKRDAVRTAQDDLAKLLDEHQQADRRLKSWEKLIELESGKAAAAALRADWQAADETFLVTRFRGD